MLQAQDSVAMIQATLATIAGLVCFAAIFVVPCIYVFRGGPYFHGVAIGWMMAVLSLGTFAVVASVMPLELASGLPQGRDIAAAMGFGWVPGIMASTVGGVSAFLVGKFRKRKKDTHGGSAAGQDEPR